METIIKLLADTDYDEWDFDIKEATFIAEDDNGLYVSDCNYVSEELYIGSVGNYFIRGEYYDCIEIREVTDTEAAEWLEEHGFVDEYLEYFGAEEA